MQQGFLILTPALTLTPALSQGEGDRRLWGWEGPFGTTGTHQFDWCHVSRIGDRRPLASAELWG